jgi:predicted metal-dependent hydrolase
MINIYEYVHRETMDKARRMLRVKNPDLIIEFSKQKTKYGATCWPVQQRIRYYSWWLEMNKFNTRYIDDVITHECAHLVTGPDHDSRFYRLCRRYGALYEGECFEDIPYHIGIPDYIIERFGTIDCN